MCLSLPGITELNKAEKRAKKMLVQIFKRPELQLLSGHIKIGLRRITTKAEFARTVARFMKAHHIRSTDKLAELLYIGNDHSEVISWLRFPCAFRFTNDRRDVEYLLSLCDLELHPVTKSYVPTIMS